MNRKIIYWKLRESEIQTGERTLIMGVLNVTPDSFSDGGRFNDPERAYAQALELEEQGADIIDIGAESTRPGSRRITADEEWQRLVPILKKLRGQLRVPLSLDTYKSEIAERALDYGVDIINDPSGLTFDPNIARVAANGNAGLILNHMRGQPETWAKLPPLQDPVNSIARDLEAMVSRARLAGVDKSRIVVDPGLGFGKRKEQNNEIVAKLRALAALDLPILIGASRKSFLAQATEEETIFATAAAVALCVFNGAHIVRVHDVKEMRPVVQVAEEIAKAGVVAEPEEEERPAARPARGTSGPRGFSKPYFEEDRPRPTRAPLARKAAVAPVAPPVDAPVDAVVAAAPVADAAGEAIDAAAETDQPVVAEAQTESTATAETPETIVAAEGDEPEAAPIKPVKAEVAESADGKPEVRPAPKAKIFEKREPKADYPPRRFDSKSGQGEGWTPPRRREFDSAPRPRAGERPGGPGGDRREGGSRPGGPPPRREYRSDGPPQREYRSDGPPRREYRSDGPPKREFRSDGPPKREYRSDGPPKREYRSDGPPPRSFRSDGPPKREYRSDGPPKRDFRGDGPPKREYRSDGPPKREYRSDGPPPRSFRSDGPPRGGPRSDGPPKREYRSDGPPKRDFPPRKPFGPGGGAPKRPFRKRP